MKTLTASVKFDQVLLDARSEGARADHEDGITNPYLSTSAKWAAWEAGRAFGPGRISEARGCAMNVQTNNGNYRMTFEELRVASTRTIAVTYCFGAQVVR